MFHAAFEGYSYEHDDEPVDALPSSPDPSVRRTVAAYLEAAPQRLGSFGVDRPESDDLIVRRGLLER